MYEGIEWYNTDFWISHNLYTFQNISLKNTRQTGNMQLYKCSTDFIIIPHFSSPLQDKKQIWSDLYSIYTCKFEMDNLLISQWWAGVVKLGWSECGYSLIRRQEIYEIKNKYESLPTIISEENYFTGSVVNKMEVKTTSNKILVEFSVWYMHYSTLISSLQRKIGTQRQDLTVYTNLLTLKFLCWHEARAGP